jgi:lipopolysaccharide/colanic/teichoic acid biosynthesis glycosyltransferase
MIIDDQASTRMLLTHYLGKFFNVIEKNSAKDAIECLKHGTPADAILADVLMPEMNGIEFLQASQTRFGTQMPRVLMLTSVENTTEKLKCFQFGARDYMIKAMTMKNYYPIIKRFFDCLVAAIALLVLSPLLILVAIAIKLESKGPVLYRAKRAGQHYRIFDMLKFRTMQVDADQNMQLMTKLNQYAAENPNFGQDMEECPFCKMVSRTCSPLLHGDNITICENFYYLKRGKNKAFYKIHNDPRVTCLGKFLRRTSIDELPQLINILKGEMSLIGNRPLPLYEAEKLTSDFAIERFNAPAGLAGLWQVVQRGKSRVTEKERINLDMEYSRTWSFKTDMHIFWKTFPALLAKENV